MKYYFSGINASGKTTLAKAAAKKTGVPYVSGSQELMRHIGVSGYPDLVKASQADLLLKFGEMISQIVSKYPENLIFDGHLAIMIQGQVFPRTGPWLDSFDAFVLVKSSVEDIYARIEADSKRERPLFLEGLSQSQKLELLSSFSAEVEKTFYKIAEKFNKPALILNNHQGHMGDALQAFIEFDKSLKK